VERVAASGRVPRRVEALQHHALASPISLGTLRPAVILPSEAENWDDADLERAMVLELEHVRRRDWASQCEARAICAFYWFHPLVWTAWRRLVLEAERACDDAVLRRSEATAYAEQLVAVARRISNSRKLPLLAMADRTDLAKRVGSVFDARQRRGPLGMAGATRCSRLRRCWL
jgi:beta-lactamase regulating signal transducer with metallopeptidase domain